ncbi:MAG: alpha/beta hydrolase, partial [Alphaproteobacteria bacterium]|nr:alpha/beta hydrolase [Alphaproteobacteria bacterium]
APDFTRDIYNALDAGTRNILLHAGQISVENDYSDEPYIFTRAFFEDGEKHCILDQMPHYPCALRLVQGMKDNDVPWQTAFRIKNAVTAAGEVEVILVEQGDHRLSRPEDLALIDTQIRAVSGL